jgi:hypothetical protein
MDVCQHIRQMKNAVFWDVTPCALVRTDVSEELSVSFIRVTKIGELGTALAVTSNRRKLRRNTETSVHTRATQRNIPEDAIFHSHRRENLKFYVSDMLVSAYQTIHHIQEDHSHTHCFEILKFHK